MSHFVSTGSFDWRAIARAQHFKFSNGLVGTARLGAQLAINLASQAEGARIDDGCRLAVHSPSVPSPVHLFHAGPSTIRSRDRRPVPACPGVLTAL